MFTGEASARAGKPRPWCGAKPTEFGVVKEEERRGRRNANVLFRNAAGPGINEGTRGRPGERRKLDAGPLTPGKDGLRRERRTRGGPRRKQGWRNMNAAVRAGGGSHSIPPAARQQKITTTHWVVRAFPACDEKGLPPSKNSTRRGGRGVDDYFKPEESAPPIFRESSFAENWPQGRRAAAAGNRIFFKTHGDF